MTSFLEAALVVCEAMIEEAGKDVKAIRPGVWYQSDAIAAHRCMAGQFAVLQTANRDEAYLGTLDCVITFADMLNERLGKTAPMIISTTLSKAYEMLSEELAARKRKPNRAGKFAK